MASVECFYENDHTIASVPFSFRNDAIRRAMPPIVNWRSYCRMTPIKDQEHTNLCWACASLSCVEAWHAIHNGVVLELSLQQLMDNHTMVKCGRGLPPHAFQHMLLHDGVSLNWEYPFDAFLGEPKNLRKATALNISGYGRVPTDDEDALMWVVAHGPVVALLEADFEFCSNVTGIHLKNSRVENLNHYVLIIGYGNILIEGQPRDYWLIQNSYGGDKWGYKGCAMVPRNSCLLPGYCNLARHAYYPTIPGVFPPFITPPPRPVSYQPCMCDIC